MTDFNAGDRGHVRLAEKQARLDERAKREVVGDLMAYGQGRQYIWELLSRAHVFTSSFAHDTVAMAFNEGERNMGLIVLGDIMAFCPEQFHVMMREANGRDNLAAERRRQRDNANSDGRDSGPRIIGYDTDAAAVASEYNPTDDLDRREPEIPS